MNQHSEGPIYAYRKLSPNVPLKDKNQHQDNYIKFYLIYEFCFTCGQKSRGFVLGPPEAAAGWGATCATCDIAASSGIPCMTVVFYCLEFHILL